MTICRPRRGHGHVPPRRAAPHRRHRRGRPGRGRRAPGHRAAVGPLDRLRDAARPVRRRPAPPASPSCRADRQRRRRTVRRRSCSSPTRWAIPTQARRNSPLMVAPIAESRRQANEIKREEPITVVIGNPPYKEKAKGRGGWIEDGAAREDVTRYATTGSRPPSGASAPTPSTSATSTSTSGAGPPGRSSPPATGDKTRPPASSASSPSRASSTAPASRRCAITCGATATASG